MTTLHSPLTVIAEAENLNEARKKIVSLIPEGFYFLSERIISDGEERIATGAAETPEEAFVNALNEIPQRFYFDLNPILQQPAKAKNEIPQHAKILKKEVLSAPRSESIRVEAFNEYEAKQRAVNLMNDRKVSMKIIGIKLVLQGTKGFLGIGKRPNHYIVEMFGDSHVKVTYKSNAKVSFDITDCSEYIEVIEAFRNKSLNNSDIETLINIGTITQRSDYYIGPRVANENLLKIRTTIIQELMGVFHCSIYSNSSNEPITEAWEALIRMAQYIRDQDDVKLLIGMVSSNKKYTAKMAIQLLGKIKDPSAIEPLIHIAIYEELDDAKKREAQSALLEIGNVKSLHLVVGWLEGNEVADDESIEAAQMLLRLILRHNTKEIKADDLHLVAHMKDTERTVRRSEFDGSTDSYEHYDAKVSINNSEFRKFAESELRSRGMQA